MERIEAVIFDWGGVLIANPAPGLMEYCARGLGVAVETYARVHNACSEPFQKGSISEAAFWQSVCGALEKPCPQLASLWGQAFRSVYSPRQEVFALAERVRARGYKTALLTNTEPPVMQFWHEQGYDMFDALVFSCAEGVFKPEQEIYRITAARLATPVGSCVLLDDRQDFIDGAVAVGMAGIRYESLEQIERELVDLGVATQEGR